MTLDRHRIDGVAPITAKILPAEVFDERLSQAGYTKAGSAPAQGNRLKVWWVHAEYARVETIYSPDGATAITAYHVVV
jgi:hypothetical protein